jgi:hypothetical protein
MRNWRPDVPRPGYVRIFTPSGRNDRFVADFTPLYDVRQLPEQWLPPLPAKPTEPPRD